MARNEKKPTTSVTVVTNVPPGLLADLGGELGEAPRGVAGQLVDGVLVAVPGQDGGGRCGVVGA